MSIIKKRMGAVGPRAVLGSQRVRPHGQPEIDKSILSHSWLLRAQDVSRSGGSVKMRALLSLIAGLLTVLSGCTKSAKEITAPATPPAPKEAATQLQQAFTTANPETKGIAKEASEAIQTANYEKAFQSLQAIKARQNLTLDQGIAVYNSERALEATLISRISAGDASAKQAYEALKKSRRN